MVDMPTYAPNVSLVTTEAFEWSDMGGNSLLLRSLPSGEMDLTLRGVGDQDFHTFRVAPPDAANFMAELLPWVQTQLAMRSTYR